jgi:hypothetical protein
MHKLEIALTILSRDALQGINRKVQMKPIEVREGEIVRALFILKWGGALTHAGFE